MAMRARSVPIALALTVVVVGCAGLLYVLLFDVGGDAAPDVRGRPTAPESSPDPGPPLEPTPDSPPPRADPVTDASPAEREPGAEPAGAAGAPEARRTGTVRGRVVGPDRLGVEGAAVEIGPVTRKAFGLLVRGPVAARAHSGADGSFRLESVPAGEDYRITLSHERYPSIDRDRVRVSPDVETDVGTFEFPAGSGLRGRVRSIEAGPLAGVDVRIVDRILPEAFGGRAPVTVRTDPDGRFRFARLRPGGVRLEVDAPEHAPARMDVELEAGRETGDVDVVLRRGVSIEGEVVDDRGVALADAGILAIGDRHKAEARTDDAGRFALAHLAPGGVYRLLAEKRGYGPPDGDGAQRDFPAGSRGVRLVLERRATLCGLVLDAGDRKPVGTFTVAWGAPDAELHHSRNVAAEDGRFEIEGVKPGSRVFEFRSPDHAPTRLGTLVMQPGDRITNLEVLLRAGGAVVGRVVRLESREPLAGALVGVTAPRPEDASVVFGGEAVDPPRWVRTTRTDAEGRFRLEHLVGDYVLKIRADGRADLDVDPVRFPDTGTRDLGDLAPGLGGTISGFVGAPSGRGDPDAEVWILAANGYSRTARTDDAGRFVFERVPPGVYDATLVKRGGKLAIEDLVRSRAGGARKVEVREGQVSIVQF